ncbi:MAG: lipoyl(octanoyl) transferase LipB, partial [Candidatus Atribacteria bacterium]|nr:lipoyl(octanoyl) transferase LipB [Candidatus Atribacteria bacterium]
MDFFLYSVLGKIDYEMSRHLQLQLLQVIYQQNLPGILLVLEHSPVFTLGKSAIRNHLLVSDEVLEREGIPVFSIERGGDITFHGPGQIVGYPLVNLWFWKKDIHLFLRALEEMLIQFLLDYGLTAFRLPPHTGVWVNERHPEKIAAIGVAVKKWITFHGFALNISTDLKYFSYIIPCGIRDKGVISLEKACKKTFSDGDREAMKRDLVDDFSGVFGFQMVEVKNEILAKWASGDGSFSLSSLG